MLLAIDVGNTNIVLGVFERTELIRSWRLQTLRERTSDELGLLVKGLFDNFKIDRSGVTGSIVGSVVPPLTGTVFAMVAQYFNHAPLVVDPARNSHSGGMEYPTLITGGAYFLEGDRRDSPG